MFRGQPWPPVRRLKATARLPQRAAGSHLQGDDAADILRLLPASPPQRAHNIDT